MFDISISNFRRDGATERIRYMQSLRGAIRFLSLAGYCIYMFIYRNPCGVFLDSFQRRRQLLEPLPFRPAVPRDV